MFTLHTQHGTHRLTSPDVESAVKEALRHHKARSGDTISQQGHTVFTFGQKAESTPTVQPWDVPAKPDRRRLARR